MAHARQASSCGRRCRPAGRPRLYQARAEGLRGSCRPDQRAGYDRHGRRRSQQHQNLAAPATLNEDQTAERDAPTVTYPYAVAGLTLVADVRLPHLSPSARTAPDLTVHVGRRPTWAPQASSIEYISAHTDAQGVPTLQLCRSEDGFSFAYADECRFWKDARAATIWTTYETTLEDACTYLVGPVLSFALRLRGDFSLHASAIATACGAVAFAGPHGAGKSTTAAALGRLGFPVLTDDVLRMTHAGDAWLAHPLGGILRLWPDGERILFGDDHRLDCITPTWHKRALPIGAAGVPAAHSAIPLAGVVFLMADAAATTITLTSMSQADAAVRLAANSSAAYLLDRRARAREFHQVAAIASRVPCALLTRPAEDVSLHETMSVARTWIASLGVDEVATA
jgi:hypothetical protein